METTHEGVATATRLAGGWSEVRAADHVIRYVRFGSGTGAPVIILTPGTPEANVWPELFEALAAGRRVYIPDLPDAEWCFAPRLAAFLDGLGLSSVTLVAPGSYCVPALEFALLEPERLQRLVLVPRGVAEETGLSGTLATAKPAREVSVMLVRRETAVDTAVELVDKFVAGG
jgi:pimeloyl-ACP methyl ester carboxylesterase